MQQHLSLRYVIAPSVNAEIIHRKKLCDRIAANARKSLIVLNTSAGYGKTVLLKDYTAVYNVPACWLNCPHNISSPSELVLYMILSMQQQLPLFGGSLVSYVESASEANPGKTSNDLVTLFVNEFIRNQSGGITFIIDDFQNLETENNSEWLAVFFDELLENLPANLKFIISTRQVPCFKSSRLEAKRNYFELNTHDLCFTAEETSFLFAEVYELSCREDTIAGILKLTGGWITAIHLAVQYGKNLEQLLPGVLNENLYSLFAEDIFDYLDAKTKKFLLSTAFLDSFTPRFCDKLLGISDSAEIINKVLEKNIFLDSFKTGNEKYYCYQKLFSDFLKVQSQSAFDQVEAGKICSAAARIYEEEGETEKAVEYYVKGQRICEAVRLVKERLDFLLENSQYRVLQRIFDQINGKDSADDADLQYCYVKYCLAANILNDEVRRKILALSDLHLSGKKAAEYTILLAEFRLLSGKPDEALSLLDHFCEDKAADKIKSEYYVLLCKTYYRMGFGYYQQLLDITEEAIETTKSGGSTKDYLEVMSLLAAVNNDAGNKHTAVNFYREALLLEKNPVSCFKHITALANLYSDMGDFENANEYMVEAEQIYSEFPVPLFERYLLRTQERFFFNLGDFNKTIKVLEELIQSKSVRANSSLLLSNLWSVVETHYFAQNHNLARQSYEQSLNYIDKSDEYFTIMDSLFSDYYVSDNIESEKTERSLLVLIEYNEKNNIKDFVPVLQLYIAKHYLYSGNPASSVEYLRKALDALCSMGEMVWCSNELIVSRPVFDFAISKNICKQFINDVFLFTYSKAELPFLTPEFRAELEERNKLLIDIKMLPFGRTEFILRGMGLEEDKWTRKKSKILLAYLMADPKRVHTKDEIIDLFFGDAPADKADTMYHSTMYNIRTALKIYDIKSDAPKRSKYKPYDYNPEYILYGDKTLRLNADFYYESDNVHFEKLYEKFRLPLAAKEDRIKSAIAAAELYAGDFLPGYYESWCEELRIKYKNMFVTLVAGLIELLEPENRNEEIVKYSERLLTEDSLNESAYLAAIKAYANMQNINMAKSLLAKMLKVFDEELGEKPSSKTLRIISEIVN